MEVDSAAPHRHRAQHGAFDAWLIWSIAVIAIGLPALFLICVSSIPVYRVDYGDLRIAAYRGEFLVPVLIMCAESIRRWTREVKGGSRIILYKIVANLLCAIAGVICMTAAIISVTAPPTSLTGKSLTVITVTSMLVGLIFGTMGVIVHRGR